MTYELMRSTLPDQQRDAVAQVVRAHHPREQATHFEHSRATAIKIANTLDAKYGGEWHGILGPHNAVYAREDDGTFFRCKIDQQIYTFWKTRPSGKPAPASSSGTHVGVPITTQAFELMRTTMPDWQRDELTTLVQNMSRMEEQTNFTHSRATAIAIAEKLDAKYGGKWSGVIGPHYAVFAREDAGTFYRCKIGTQIYTFWKNTAPGGGGGSSCPSGGKPTAAQIQAALTVHDSKMEEWMKTRSVEVVATGLAEHASSVDEFTVFVANRLDDVLGVGYGWKCFDETGRWTCHHQKAAKYNLRINYMTHYVTVWFYEATGTQQKVGEQASFGNDETTFHTVETFSAHLTTVAESSQSWAASATAGGKPTASQIQSTMTVHDFKMEERMKTQSLQIIATGLAEHDGSVDELTLWIAHRLDEALGVGQGWKCFDETGRWTCHHQKAAQFNLRINYRTHYVTIWLYPRTSAPQQAGEHVTFGNESTSHHTAETFSSHQSSTWSGEAILGAAAGAVAAGGVAAGAMHHGQQQQGSGQYQQGSVQHHQNFQQQQQQQQQSQGQEEEKKHHYGTAAAIAGGALAIGGIAAAVGQHKKHEHETQQQHTSTSQQVSQIQSEITVHDLKMDEAMKTQSVQIIATGLAEHASTPDEFTVWVAHRLDEVLRVGTGWKCFDEAGRWTCHHQKAAQYNLRINYRSHYVTTWFYSNTSAQQPGEFVTFGNEATTQHTVETFSLHQGSSVGWGAGAAAAGAIASGGVAAGVAQHSQQQQSGGYQHNTSGQYQQQSSSQCEQTGPVQQHAEKKHHYGTAAAIAGGALAVGGISAAVGEHKKHEHTQQQQQQTLQQPQQSDLAVHIQSQVKVHDYKMDEGMKDRCIDVIATGLAQHANTVDDFTVWVAHRLDEVLRVGNGWRCFDEAGRWTCHHQKAAQYNLRINYRTHYVTLWFYPNTIRKQQSGEHASFGNETTVHHTFETFTSHLSSSQSWSAGEVGVGGKLATGMAGMQLHEHQQQQQQQQQVAEEDEKKKHQFGTAAAIGAGALAVGGIAAAIEGHKKHEQQQQQQQQQQKAEYTFSGSHPAATAVHGQGSFSGSQQSSMSSFHGGSLSQQGSMLGTHTGPAQDTSQGGSGGGFFGSLTSRVKGHASDITGLAGLGAGVTALHGLASRLPGVGGLMGKSQTELTSHTTVITEVGVSEQKAAVLGITHEIFERQTAPEQIVVALEARLRERLGAGWHVFVGNEFNQDLTRGSQRFMLYSVGELKFTVYHAEETTVSHQHIQQGGGSGQGWTTYSQGPVTTTYTQGPTTTTTTVHKSYSTYSSSEQM